MGLHYFWKRVLLNFWIAKGYEDSMQLVFDFFLRNSMFFNRLQYNRQVMRCVTTSENEWKREVQQVTRNDNKWRRMITSGKTSDNEYYE